MSSGPTRTSLAPSYTDEGASSPSARVQKDITDIKAVHINELRTAIDAQRASRQSTPAYSWAAPNPTVANSSMTTKVQLLELRAAELSTLLTGCSTDTTPIPVWADSDESIVVNSTAIKATHINELRIYLNTLDAVTCLCNCNYACADCGNNMCAHH